MSSPAVTAETDPPRVTVDAQDPLPESNWAYRRVLVILGRVAFTAMFAAILWFLRELGEVNPAGAINGLVIIGYCVTGILIIDTVLYLIAPSAEQFGNILQTVSAMKSGITFQTKATAETAGAKVTTTATAGPAAPEPEKPLAPSDPAGERHPDDPAPTESVGLRPRERGRE